MVTTAFLVAPPAALADISWGALLALAIPGVILLLLALRGSKEKRLKLVAIGVILLLSGGFVFFLSNPFQQNSITVGTGSIRADAPPYFNLNITKGQIASLYVENLTTWNITISARTSGTALGSFDSGFFKLSNGANADVLTTGNTNLVIVLSSGTYVILGPQDFQSFLSDFEQSGLVANYPPPTGYG